MNRGRGGAGGPPSTITKGEVREQSWPSNINKPDEFMAGRLRQFVSVWRQITSDREILQTISGSTIEFDSEIPVQTKTVRKSIFNAAQNHVGGEEMQKLLEKKVIEQTHHESDEFIYQIFFLYQRKMVLFES